jgi:hypothetical protein
MCSASGLIRAADRPDATLLVEMLATGAGDNAWLLDRFARHKSALYKQRAINTFAHVLMDVNAMRSAHALFPGA